MKPVVIVTVYRRYFELGRALRRLREVAGEFAGPPAVVVVWARPELPRLWFFRRLRDDGLFDSLLTRPALPGEGESGGTTYPESHNIRAGLEYARDHFGTDAYFLVQAADVLPRDGACRLVDESMRAGAPAVVFAWGNACVDGHAWHTNFFAVSADPRWWPPLAGPGEQDVLEWAWGKKLLSDPPPGLVRDNNSSCRRFSHDHLSETLPAWPERCEQEGGGVGLCVAGRRSWWRRLWGWLLRK